MEKISISRVVEGRKTGPVKRIPTETLITIAESCLRALDALGEASAMVEVLRVKFYYVLYGEIHADFQVVFSNPYERSSKFEERLLSYPVQNLPPTSKITGKLTSEMKKCMADFISQKTGGLEDLRTAFGKKSA